MSNILRDYVPPTPVSPEERRRRVRAMLDEDDQVPLASGSKRTSSSLMRVSSSSPSKRVKGKGRASTPPPVSAAAKAFPSPNSANRLALKFDGKVYRTLDTSLPGVDYSTKGDFLGAPDEQVGELERELGEQKRRNLQREMLREPPRVSTPKGKRRPPQDETGPLRLVKQVARPTLEPLGLPFSATIPPRPSAKLPDVLDRLQHLHAALESALFAHLAEAGGSAFASSSSSISSANSAIMHVRIPRLIDFGKLKRLIESGGRNFGVQDLARLCWVWQGCGFRGDEDDLHVTGQEEGLESDEVGGMGFVVSKTRLLIGGGKFVPSLALGIHLTIKSNPQLAPMELLPPPSPGRVPRSPTTTTRGRQGADSPGGGSRTGREGMSVVAFWSQGSEARRREFGKRLRDWIGSLDAGPSEAGDVLGSRRVSEAFPRVIDEIPKATLPSLVQQVVLAPARTNSTSSTSSPLSSPSAGGGRGQQSMARPIEGLLEGKKAVTSSGTAQDRRRAMEERIRAKALSRQPSTSANFSALSSGESSPNKSLKREKLSQKGWHAERMERYKRNSMLSRMGPVADGVWMLFNMAPRKRAILLEDVATSIAKSSKIALSLDEAEETLSLLYTLCPTFATVRKIDKEDWLVLSVEGMELKDVKEVFRKELERNEIE